MKPWMMFVAMVMLFWGAYVPTIHEGQLAIGGKSRGLWSFLLVGLAYFVVAVLLPLIILASQGEIRNFPSARGTWISLLAGGLGAVGALGIILALMSGGSPKVVPPLVFAGAPIVATLISMMLHRPQNAPSVWFFVGILMAASGASLVLRFKPS